MISTTNQKNLNQFIKMLIKLIFLTNLSKSEK